MSTTIDTIRTDAEGTETADAEATGTSKTAVIEAGGASQAADSRANVSDAGRATEAETPPAAWLVGDGPVDVSDISPTRVTAYARRADGAVHFERKGGRTYLVAP